MIRRRTMIVGALAAPAVVHAQALAWPQRPVRFINPFTPGSAVDVVARLIARDLSERLGQQFIVDNRTGASGIIGTEAAARAQPDGYTWLVGSPGTMGINPFLHRTLPYDAVRDFVPVSHVVSFPQVMVVNPSGAIHSLADLIAAAKAAPGKLNYASSGSGATSHLAFELIRSATGIDIVHVPFRGGTPAIQAVMQNEVQVAVEGIPSLPGFLSAGQLRPIAVTSLDRSPKLPDVPAVSETVPGFDASAWVIFFAPAGTPQAVVDQLSAEMHTSLNRPEVRDRLLDQGATVIGSDPTKTGEFHRRELEKWRRAVEISGARVD